MTAKAKLACRLDQVRIISGPMHVVAAKTSHATAVHQALHEIISLHSILVAGAVGKVRKARFAQLVFFEPPEIFQVQSLMKTGGPVVVLAFYRILQWLSL